MASSRSDKSFTASIPRRTLQTPFSTEAALTVEALSRVHLQTLLLVNIMSNATWMSDERCFNNRTL